MGDDEGVRCLFSSWDRHLNICRYRDEEICGDHTILMAHSYQCFITPQWQCSIGWIWVTILSMQFHSTCKNDSFYLCYRVTVTFYKPFAMAELSSTYTLPLKRKFILPFRLILVNKPLQGMAPTECPLSACLPACLLAYLLACLLAC